MEKSSPPTLATVSPSSTQASSLAPTAFSKASPTGWPSVSLMSLKRSRSRQSTARLLPFRPPSSARSMRSRSSVRLGSSVRMSWCAMWATRASIRRYSVMSSCVESQPSSGIG